MSKQAKHLYEFGRFRLDATERVLLRDGEPVALTPKAIETLIVLVESSGHIVEKDELMKAVWPDTFVGEDSLTRNVSVLRRVLGEDSANAAYIETLPKRGYRFTASVQERWDGQADLVVERHARLRITQEDLNHQNETGQSFAREATAAGEIAGPLQRRLSRALPVVAIALVGVIAALAYLWVARRSQPVESAAQVSSLAVLPFKSLSADGGDEYLGLGIADALILKLGSAQRLVVRPVRAVLKYGGSEQDPLAAGRDLQVEAILDGSIQKTGDHIRVTARLLRVSDGAQLWAEKFDENTTDIFRIQDSISEKASGALALKLIGRERNPYHTENREAYELYLRGRYFWNRRTEGEKILKYFSQAIEKDPNYAPAYAGLADYYATHYAYEDWSKGEVAAVQALQLDDTLAEGHASLGFIKMFRRWDWGAAEQEFRRAIELNPNYATGHQWYALYLAARGRLDEAKAQMRQALEIDPLSLIINADMGQIYYFAREYDQAIATCQKVLDLDPNFRWAHEYLYYVYLKKGMYDEAVEVIARIYPDEGPAHREQYKTAGVRGYILAGIEETRAYPISWNRIAEDYALLGEKEQALHWLEKAVDDRNFFMVFLKVNPLFDSLRSDPRFAALERRVGLAE